MIYSEQKNANDTVANQYIRTDLAAECPMDEEDGELKGIIFTQSEHGIVTTSRLEVTDERGSELIGKPVGNYVTLSFPRLWLESDQAVEGVRAAVAAEIRKLADALAPKRETVLIAGLGNRRITADAIGPQAAEMVTVTRHIKVHDRGLFDQIGGPEVACLVPGVSGETGIETVELIKPAVDTVRPQLVIVIDALAARSPDRLATTVQITDTGISPGSGVGNNRRPINRESIGVPVIAVGVPTVVDSSTLVYDALEKAGIEEVPDSLRQVLENGRGFFVSIKESDVAVKELSGLVSGAIDQALAVV